MKKYILIALLFFLSTFFVKAQNTNLGTNAGNAGTNNTSIGASAGDVVTGTYNTFLGYNAGKSDIDGSSNTFVGAWSGITNTSGYDNFFGGYTTGYSNTTGFENVFIGRGTGYSNTTGSKNVAIGSFSWSGSTGSSNTFLGYNSGPHTINSSSSNNVMLGYESGKNANNNGNGNIFLGYQSGYNETGSNKLYIENSSNSIALVNGDFTSRQVGINIKPISAHTLTVGGTIHATGIYVNGQSITDAGFEFWTKVGNNIWNNTGNVGIGTTLTNNPNNYKLAVNGKLGAQEIQIENNSLTWSDFVFYKNYKLRTLEELDQYIQENQHLPEIPTEKEVRENGILVSEMNAKLLQKVEELTLYVIELKKEIETLKKK